MKLLEWGESDIEWNCLSRDWPPIGSQAVALSSHCRRFLVFFFFNPSLFILREIIHFIIFYSLFATCYYIYYIYYVIFTISFNSVDVDLTQGFKKFFKLTTHSTPGYLQTILFEMEIASTGCLLSVGRRLELSLPQFCFLVWGRSRRNRIWGADFGTVSIHLLRFSRDNLCSFSQRRIWKT